MDWTSGSDPASGLPALPALLAEYGRLAARLPGADPDQARSLRERLAELDTEIDCQVAELGTRRP